MPLGRYPERVKAFRKWAAERIDKASITDSVTGSTTSRTHPRRRRRNRRFRRRLKKEE